MGEVKKKLVVRRYEPKMITVESYTTKEWEDFVLIEADIDNSEDIDTLSDMFREISERTPGKEFVLIPRQYDAEFYGVEVEDESGTGE